MDLWEAFDSLEPIGNRDMLRILAEIAAATNSGRYRDVEARDFAPWLPEPRPQSTAEQQARCRLFAELHNA
jgi:hypothetical protein